MNPRKEDLGKIEHLMINLANGRIACAVLSFGGFPGMGDKLFAIPWSALTVDTVDKQFILNVDKELIKGAPGFDKDHGPNMADHGRANGAFKYYGTKLVEALPAPRGPLAGNLTEPTEFPAALY